MKVLLTGGTGFLAAHCIEALLEHGHLVVTTVRSKAKGQKVLDAHPNHSAEQLSFSVVQDIGTEDAFNDAVVASPPFDAVIHTASPFHFNTDNPKRDLLEPAIRGTTSLLKTIKANAPSVRKVVLTSSFAAILNFKTHPKVYTESNWNPVTEEDAEKSAGVGYPGSKTFAERAAWSFVEHEKPNFALSVMNPPLIFGPVLHHLNGLSTINTSNTIFRDIIEGKYVKGLPPTGRFPDWVDVRDVALAHVRALDLPESDGKRFILSAGKYTNEGIARVVRANFPYLKDKLPALVHEEVVEDEYGVDSSRAKEVLGLEFRAFDQCVIDSVASLMPLLK